MQYIECNNALDYFRSIPIYAKPVAETNRHNELTGFYYIKFNCSINFARAVYADFIKLKPQFKELLKFHVNINNTAVIFGGRFSMESKADYSLYCLLNKHRAEHGKAKPKKMITEKQVVAFI